MVAAPLLLLGSVRFVVWTAERILEVAEAELYDERTLMAELADLNRRYDQGLVDEASFEAEEDELMARLREARARRSP